MLEQSTSRSLLRLLVPDLSEMELSQLCIIVEKQETELSEEEVATLRAVEHRVLEGLASVRASVHAQSTYLQLLDQRLATLDLPGVGLLLRALPGRRRKDDPGKEAGSSAPGKPFSAEGTIPGGQGTQADVDPPPGISVPASLRESVTNGHRYQELGDVALLRALWNAYGRDGHRKEPLSFWQRVFQLARRAAAKSGGDEKVVSVSTAPKEAPPAASPLPLPQGSAKAAG